LFAININKGSAYPLKHLITTEKTSKAKSVKFGAHHSNITLPSYINNVQSTLTLMSFQWKMGEREWQKSSRLMSEKISPCAFLHIKFFFAPTQSFLFAFLLLLFQCHRLK
jgi:hypothetical protein